MDTNNGWDNIDDDIMIEDDNIFDKLEQAEQEQQKQQVVDPLDLFDQLQQIKKDESQFDNDLNFLNNLAQSTSISKSAESRENSPKKAMENTNQQSDQKTNQTAQYGKNNIIGSLFSYLTSSDAQQTNQAPNKNANQNQNHNAQVKEQIQQSMQNSISNIGASYFAAAKETFLGSSSNQNQLEPNSNIDKKQQIKMNNFKDFLQINQQNVENGVLQNLINQNKELKSLLIRQRIEIKKSYQGNDKQQNQSNLEEIIQQANYEQNLLQDFDSQKEFESIQQILNTHRLNFDQFEISYLYSICFHSKDLLEVQNLKVKIFQQIAERALRNQEIIFKQTQRRYFKNSDSQNNDQNQIQIFIENNQLRQTNQGLRGQLEQQEQTFKTFEQKSIQTQSYYLDRIQKLHQKLQIEKEKIKYLKINFLKIKQEQLEFQNLLKDQKMFNSIKNLVLDSANKYDKQLDTYQKLIFQKNKEIGDLFMKQKKQEEQSEQKLKDLEKSIRSEQEKDLGSIVFQKNNEISNQFNQILELEQKIQNFQQQRDEQNEIFETIQEESQMIKEQIRKLQVENKQIYEQLSNYQKQNQDYQQIKELLENKQNEIEDLHNQLNEKDSEIQEKQDYIQMKNDEIIQAEEEIDQYQIEVEKLKYQVQQIQNEKQKLINQSKEKQQNNDIDLQQKLLEFQVKNKELEIKIQEQEKQIIQSKQQLNKEEIITEQIQFDKIEFQNKPTVIKQVKTALKMPPLDLNTIKKPEILLNQTNQTNKLQDFDNIQHQIKEKDNKQIENLYLQKQKSVELNTERINEWGESIDSEFEMINNQPIQNSNIQQNDNINNQELQNQNSKQFIKSDCDEQYLRMQSAMNESNLEKLISQIDAPLIESVKVDLFFDQLKQKKEEIKAIIGNELDQEVFQNNIEDDFILNQDPFLNVDTIASNQQQDIYLVDQIQNLNVNNQNDQQWDEIDIQIQSDRNQQDNTDLVVSYHQQSDSSSLPPQKKRKTHKKQKSVHLNKSNQFQNFNSQQFEEQNQDEIDQENKSEIKEEFNQFFPEFKNNKDTLNFDKKANLQSISEEDANGQGESSRKKENSKDQKLESPNDLNSLINAPKIEITQSSNQKLNNQNILNQKWLLSQNNIIQQKDKDNDFNSSVFPDSIHNNDEEKDYDADIMITSGDVNLQLLDSVQSPAGRLSFIHEESLNNIIQGSKTPLKEIKEFIIEYNENQWLENQIMDDQMNQEDKKNVDLTQQEVNQEQKAFHKKASQSFHQRNAELIDQAIIGTAVYDQNNIDENLLEQSLKQQLNLQINSNNEFYKDDDTPYFQKGNLVNQKIIPPAQPNEQINIGEKEQILSDLGDELDIIYDQQLDYENLDTQNQIIQNIGEQKIQQEIEIIPEMEMEDDDEQQLLSQNEEIKQENLQIEENQNVDIDFDLQNDVWGENNQESIDIIQNNNEQINTIDILMQAENQQIDFQKENNESFKEKSQNYQNIRKQNKQKQIDKLNLKDKFQLMNKMNEIHDYQIKNQENQDKQQIDQIIQDDIKINSEILTDAEKINRMIVKDINEKEKQELILGNIDNLISIETINANRTLETARVQKSDPLQQFQQEENQIWDYQDNIEEDLDNIQEQQIIINNQKFQGSFHGHSNSQQFVKKNQNQSKPLETIRSIQPKNKKQVPTSALKNMLENVSQSNLPSESLEEVEDSYKESEFYSPIKNKKLEDQLSYSQRTSSEFNQGLSSQKKLRRMQLNQMNQIEEDSLQEVFIEKNDNDELYREEIEKVIEDVKGEEMDDDDKIQNQQNDIEIDLIFSELESDNYLQNDIGKQPGLDQILSQDKVEILDQIIQGSQNEQQIDLQQNDQWNELISIKSIVSGSQIHSVRQEEKEPQEENINQLFDSVLSEKKKNQQVQIQMDQVQKNFRQKIQNLNQQENQ